MGAGKCATPLVLRKYEIGSINSFEFTAGPRTNVSTWRRILPVLRPRQRQNQFSKFSIHGTTLPHYRATSNSPKVSANTRPIVAPLVIFRKFPTRTPFVFDNFLTSIK